MSHRRFAVWLVLTVLFAGLVAGCGDDSRLVRPSQVVVPTPTAAVVAGTLEVTQMGTGDRVWYVFAVKLTESKGVPATVNEAGIHFDNGWGGECSFGAASLRQTRVPAKGTLALDPLTCDNFNEPAFNAVVDINLTDNNGYTIQLGLSWVRNL